MAFSIEGRAYLAAYAIWSDPADDARHGDWVVRHTRSLAASVGKGVYLGDTDFTRRPDRFVSEAAFRRLEEIRRRRDPDGLFCSYLIADGAELNGEPDRRSYTPSGP
jgi:hypothetical protein